MQDSHKFLQDVQDIARYCKMDKLARILEIFLASFFSFLQDCHLLEKPLARFLYASCKVVPNVLQGILLLRIITVQHIIVDLFAAISSNMYIYIASS